MENMYGGGLDGARRAFKKQEAARAGSPREGAAGGGGGCQEHASRWVWRKKHDVRHVRQDTIKPHEGRTCDGAGHVAGLEPLADARLRVLSCRRSASNSGQCTKRSPPYLAKIRDVFPHPPS